MVVIPKRRTLDGIWPKTIKYFHCLPFSINNNNHNNIPSDELWTMNNSRGKRISMLRLKPETRNKEIWRNKWSTFHNISNYSFPFAYCEHLKQIITSFVCRFCIQKYKQLSRMVSGSFLYAPVFQKWMLITDPFHCIRIAILVCVSHFMNLFINLRND